MADDKKLKEASENLEKIKDEFAYLDKMTQLAKYGEEIGFRILDPSLYQDHQETALEILQMEQKIKEIVCKNNDCKK